MKQSWLVQCLEPDCRGSSEYHMDYIKPFFRQKTTQTTNKRPNRNILYARQLPLEVFPVPPFIPSNPVSYIQVLYTFLSTYLSSKKSHGQPYAAYYSAATRSVHVTDDTAAWALWQSGFFGKGSLSRSEPEWLEREKRRLAVANGTARSGGTAAEVTRKRREERNAGKRERARAQREELEEQLRTEGKLIEVKDEQGEPLSGQSNGHPKKPEATLGPADVHALPIDLTSTQTRHLPQSIRHQNTQATPSHALQNQEHLQLTPHEAFFLSYGLGVLQVYSTANGSSKLLTDLELLELFRRSSTFPPLPAPSNESSLPPDDRFLLHYVVYHHFRSLGWVVRPGIKFAVDLLLYARGPVFAHAEFAIIILPSYSRWPKPSKSNPINKEQEVWREQSEWWWLHAANRVQNQVLKTLVLVYVEIPTQVEVTEIDRSDIGALLRLYSVREFVIKRWTPNRNRG